MEDGMFWLAALLFVIVFLFIRLLKDKQKELDKTNILLYQYRQKEAEVESLHIRANNELKEARVAANRILKDAEENESIILSRAYSSETDSLSRKKQLESEIETLLRNISDEKKQLEVYKSNLTLIPYASAVIADFDTRGIKLLADGLDWGHSYERFKKVESIREIRKRAQLQIDEAMQAKYQLEYAIRMFPALEDFLETDFNDLPTTSLDDLTQEAHDVVRNYVSADEYNQLSSAERNQLALDRYWTSHQRSNWQVGRDYEMYVGYQYEQKGYSVQYYGALNGLEDLGRDLIGKKDSQIVIVQCKYWSSKKTIHEKHINQLYGTMICYCYENNIPIEDVRGVLVTNIFVSETARKFAKYLGIELAENYPLKQYPCIKCNINKDKDGNITKIYHLPFDQQYDSCVIRGEGEFYALTCAEAEKAGFRRAYRWHST